MNLERMFRPKRGEASQRLLNTMRDVKTKKQPVSGHCPRCGKAFKRLDLHAKWKCKA